MPLFLVLALQCLFPIFDLTRVDDFVGISIVNRENQTREFSVTATAPDGTGAQTGMVSVPAGGQRAQLIQEILGTAKSPTAGWIRMDSTTSSCSSYLASGNDDMLDGADGPATTSTTLFIPNVSVFTGFVELNYVDTYLALVNPGTNPANVMAQLFGLDGVSRGSIAITVPAGGSRNLTTSAAFRDLLPDNRPAGKAFEGYIRLNSNVPIAAWERIETPLSRKLIRGRTVEEIHSTTLALIPHFAIGGNYQSIVNLVNPTAASVALDVSAIDDRGNTIGETIRVTLTAGQGLRSFADEFFRVVNRTPSVISGYIRIREAQGAAFQIVGDIEISTFAFSTRGSSMLYAVADSPGTSWLLPFASSSNSYFTGYAIVNPNEQLAVQTDVQVEVVNAAGIVVEKSTISLSPRNRQTAVVNAAVPSGYIRLSANFPIFVLGAIGTRDGKLLDQLPAIP